MLFLVVFGSLMVLLAGCGGGTQSGNESQDGGTPDKAKEQQQGDEAARKKPRKAKVALGTIEQVKSKKGRVIVLQPTREIQGGEQMVFRIKKNAKITLGGKEAELADIKEGQQAQIRYVQRNERNRARAVMLFEGGETPPSEKGEQPSKGGEKTG